MLEDNKGKPTASFQIK